MSFQEPSFLVLGVLESSCLCRRAWSSNWYTPAVRFEVAGTTRMLLQVFGFGRIRSIEGLMFVLRRRVRANPVCGLRFLELGGWRLVTSGSVSPLQPHSFLTLSNTSSGHGLYAPILPDTGEPIDCGPQTGKLAVARRRPTMRQEGPQQLKGSQRSHFALPHRDRDRCNGTDHNPAWNMTNCKTSPDTPNRVLTDQPRHRSV